MILVSLVTAIIVVVIYESINNTSQQTNSQSSGEITQQDGADMDDAAKEENQDTAAVSVEGSVDASSEKIGYSGASSGGNSNSNSSSGNSSSDGNSRSQATPSSSSNINASDIIGYWRLDGTKYATLLLGQDGHWQSNFMDYNPATGTFISTENDGWVPQNPGFDDYGSWFTGANISSVFTKATPQKSVDHLVQNYGLSYKDGKMYLSLNGHQYSFTRTSSVAKPTIWAKIRELDISFPQTKSATSVLCLKSGDSVTLHIVRDSLPFVLKNYSSKEGFDIVIEQLADDSNGDYTLRISKPYSGNTSFDYLIYLPGLRLRIPYDC